MVQDLSVWTCCVLSVSLLVLSRGGLPLVIDGCIGWSAISTTLSRQASVAGLVILYTSCTRCCMLMRISPAAYIRQGVQHKFILLSVGPTPVGPCLVSANGKGACRHQRLRQRWSPHSMPCEWSDYPGQSCGSCFCPLSSDALPRGQPGDVAMCAFWP